MISHTIPVFRRPHSIKHYIASSIPSRSQLRSGARKSSHHNSRFASSTSSFHDKHSSNNPRNNKSNNPSSHQALVKAFAPFIPVSASKVAGKRPPHSHSHRHVAFTLRNLAQANFPIKKEVMNTPGFSSQLLTLLNSIKQTFGEMEAKHQVIILHSLAKLRPLFEGNFPAKNFQIDPYFQHFAETLCRESVERKGEDMESKPDRRSPVKEKAAGKHKKGGGGGLENCSVQGLAIMAWSYAKVQICHPDLLFCLATEILSRDLALFQVPTARLNPNHTHSYLLTSPGHTFTYFLNNPQ